MVRATQCTAGAAAKRRVGLQKMDSRRCFGTSDGGDKPGESATDNSDS